MSQHLSKTAKRFAVLVAAMLVCALLFSVLFLVVEAHHDCDGDDCAICAQITVCENLLQKLTFTVLALTASVSGCRIASVFIRSAVGRFRQATLITLKTKLSD
ncbi:MAG: hypothetical protein IJV40_16010 [Oscillospiraceae bacterium]|nr:hypothetical protein [Oscillospiraceae bacterium]